MNGLHDLLDKLKKLEEAAAAPTTFTPQYYHERNIGPIMPVMMTDPGVFWVEVSATNDPEMGGRRGMGAGGKTIQRLYGDPNARGATAVGSVDGKLVGGKPVPFGPGETWQTDLEKDKQAQQAQQAQQAKATADANTAAKAAKVKQFTDLLVKAGVYTVPAAPATPVGNYSFAPASGNSAGIKLPALKSGVQEGIVFKSRIGQLLAESGALKGLTVSDTLRVLTEASALSKAEYSLLSKLYGELSVEYPGDPQLAPLIAAYDKVAPVYSSDPAAASASDVAPAPNASVPVKAGDRAGGIQSQSGTVSAADSEKKADGAVAAAPSKAAPASAGDVIAAGIASGEKTNAHAGAADLSGQPPAKVLPQAVLDLAKANGIEDPNSIKAGNTITLADGKTKYTIVKGDTLADIAAGKFKGVDPTKTTGTVSAPVAAPVAADKTTTATTIKVRKGDTLTSIAKSCTPPVTVDDLIKVNPGIDPKKLRIDQTINLPANVKAGILPAGDAPKVADAIPKITDVPPMPNLPEPPPPKRETGVIGTLTDDPTYQNWLRKNVKNPKADDLYWVNGERYEATLRRGRLTWIKDQPFGNAERTAQLRNYTGPDSEADAFATAQQKIWTDAQKARIAGKVKESTGFIDDELNRIVSLVHHR